MNSGAPERERVARRDQRREGRRQAILDAALRVLRARGHEAFSTSVVASEADVSKAALFYYFTSKEALLGALAKAVFEEESRVLLHAVESAATGVDALGALARAHFHFHRRDLARFRAVSSWLQAAGTQPELVEGGVYPTAKHINDRLEQRLVDDGALHEDVHPRRLANVALLLGHGLLALSSTLESLGGQTHFSADDLLDEACAALQRGALARSATTDA